uniref:Uncharacterized protein n=1 Tax=Ananas comosus var. bracteatus TaxID=296719 RepID=A0A6V7NTH2_ANACO|nr:unnamed protein product [Ananas comosus var. bracteatus]
MISTDKNPSGSNGLKQAPLEAVPAQGSGAAPVQRAEEEEGLEEDEDLVSTSAANKWDFEMALASGFTSATKCDSNITLIEYEKFDTVYLANKRSLSRRRRGFAIHHKLADGDVLVFQLIKSTKLR